MHTEHGTAESSTPDTPAVPLTLAPGGAPEKAQSAPAKSAKSAPATPRKGASGTKIPGGVSLVTQNGQQLLNGEPVLDPEFVRQLEGQTVDQGLLVITTTFPVKDGSGVTLDTLTLEALNEGKPLIVPATPQGVSQALQWIAQKRATLQQNIDQQKATVREKHREQQKLLQRLQGPGRPGLPGEQPAPPAPNRAQRRAARKR
jgi:hypothetical protein